MFRHKNHECKEIRSLDISEISLRSAILENGGTLGQGHRYVFEITSVKIPASELVCLDTKITSISELETKILVNLFLVGHFEKWRPLRPEA